MRKVSSKYALNVIVILLSTSRSAQYYYFDILKFWLVRKGYTYSPSLDEHNNAHIESYPIVAARLSRQANSAQTVNISISIMNHYLFNWHPILAWCIKVPLCCRGLSC